MRMYVEIIFDYGRGVLMDNPGTRALRPLSGWKEILPPPLTSRGSWKHS